MAVVDQDRTVAIATPGLSTTLVVYVGVAGELSYTTDTKRLVYHDGSTPGGLSLPTPIIIATVAPSSAPSAVGTIYINTSGPKIYIATETADISGWASIYPPVYFG